MTLNKKYKFAQTSMIEELWTKTGINDGNDRRLEEVGEVRG